MGVESASAATTRPIQLRLYRVRGHQVILDRDLAALYGMRTRVLNQYVKRHIKRFPSDFAFHLTRSEWQLVRPGRIGRGGQGYVPRGFTEQGVMMVASILRGSRAIAISIEIMRAFVKSREERAVEPRSILDWGDGLFTDQKRIDLLEREILGEKPGTVTYFIQSGTDGPIKIGVTTNFASRFRSLEMTSPTPLIVLGVVDGDIESECHVVLAKWRLHGEWFQPSPEVLEFVREQIAFHPPVN